MAKKLFIGAVVFGLAINFFSDLFVLNQSKVSATSGEWVYHSYHISQQIDAIKIDVLESQINKVIGSQLFEKIQALESSVEDIPSQKKRAEMLSKLSEPELLRYKYNPAIEILSEMNAAEAALLALRLKTDEKENSTALTLSLFANAIDIALILLFVGFYFYEQKIASKIQGALAKTLINIDANRQSLQIALAQKDIKLKTVVHDLKNPLGSIKGFAELMYEDATNKDSVIEMTGIIQKISNNTLALVGALLDDNNSMRKEPVQILKCLNETCSFLTPVAKEKGQRIELKNHSYEFSLEGQEHQILDIFFNVIGNALKFSPKGSLISVETRDENGFHEIQVKDEGPGFTEQDFSHLFAQGAKLSAKPTGNEVSTGLGLYSVKQTIDSLGGTIAVTNGLEKGACVTIRFPENRTMRTVSRNEINRPMSH